MAGVMAVTFFVALRWLPRGRLESVDGQEEFLPATARQGTAIR
jgi:hypothetical protein